MYRPRNWNKLAEAEIERLGNPLPQSERTYFEAGANAMLSGLLQALLEKKVKIQRRAGCVAIKVMEG